MTESKQEFIIWQVPIKDDIAVIVCGIGVANYQWVLDSFNNEVEIRDKWFTVKAGDVVLDIGAGYGSYTLWALAMGAVRVISWEPDKENVFCFTTNIALNNFVGRCDVISALAGEASGTHDGFDLETKSIVRQEGVVERRLVLSVDDVVIAKKLPKIDFIKIDVEGAEEWVLSGAKETLAKYSPSLIIECHEGFVHGIWKRVTTLLDSLGYSLTESLRFEESVDGNGWGLWRKKI